MLAHLMKLLNERYNYGLKLVLLSVDEGITGELLSQIIYLHSYLCMSITD